MGISPRSNKLVTIVMILLVGLIGAIIITKFVSNQPEYGEQPLTRLEAIEMIEMCEVTSITVGSPSSNDILLTNDAGISRVTDRFSSENYEKELQTALDTSSC